MSKFYSQKILFLLAILLSFQIAVRGTNKNKTGLFSQSELITQIETKKSFLLLDVRTKEEYEAGHIPGAVNIDFKKLESRINEIDNFKNFNVILYCERGIRAQVAEAILHKAGFQSIIYLDGQMFQWRKNSLPIKSN